jgi:hypothetical protein
MLFDGARGVNHPSADPVGLSRRPPRPIPFLSMAGTLDIDVHELTPEEGRELLDGMARSYLGMSGEEFVRAWDAGEFEDDPDRPGLMRVAMLVPLGR